MKAVLSMGWQLISFRAGPAALPYAPRMLLPLVVINLVLSFLLQQLADSGMNRPVLQLSAMALAADAGWVWLLLRRRGWDSRWMQTFMALVLVDTLITLLAAPISLLLLGAGDALVGVLMLLQLVMTLWSLSARGFVYQEALEIPRWRGVLLALVPLFAVMVLTLVLFPELLPAAATASQGK